MDAMREIALAYYERATEKEKDLFEDFFTKIDVNGDGTISLTEFKNSAWSGRLASYEDAFIQLDANGDGILDFFEVLTLYYIVNKASLPTCNGCSLLLFGPYFSCLPCLEKSSTTYDLCCGCYRRGDSDLHEHSSEFMKDHQSLLMFLRNKSAQQKTSNGGIAELREIARSYYKAGSPEVQALAYEFFKSMDTDGDDKVDRGEFLTFMKKVGGHTQTRSPDFFTELDQNGDGTLDFWEVMTLYYIFKSGRPFCDGCEQFIPGMYFSCVECFNVVGRSSFDLCLECYRSPSTRCDHTHNGRAQFLDNYALLVAMKNQALATATGVNQSEPCRCSTSNAVVPAPQSNVYLNTGPSYNTSYTTAVYHPNYNNSNAIVPASDWQKWNTALYAMERAISVGSITATMCTIL